MQNYFVHFYTGRVSIYQSMYIQYLVYYFILVKSFCSVFDKATMKIENITYIRTLFG